MKRSIIVIIALILFLPALKAQDKAKPFYFSVRIGPSLNWFKSNSDAVSTSGIMSGISWGALCEFPVLDNFSFVSGFNIHIAGGNVNYQGSNQNIPVNISEKYTLKYMELPAMLKIRTNEVNNVLYYMQFGFGTAFRLNSKVERSFKLAQSSSSTPNFAQQNVNSDNLTSFFRESMLIGIGTQYSFREYLKLFGGLNFNNGFTDILKKGPYNANDPKVISNFVELNIGLYF